jgi:hypothetical protein
MGAPGGRPGTISTPRGIDAQAPATERLLVRGEGVRHLVVSSSWAGSYCSGGLYIIINVCVDIPVLYIHGAIYIPAPAPPPASLLYASSFGTSISTSSTC